LTDAVVRSENWATPTAHLMKDFIKPMQGRRAHQKIANQVYSLLDETQGTQDGAPGPGQRINPDFVDALMGLPVGWTDCDSRVTELSRYKQRMRSALWSMLSRLEEVPDGQE